MRYWRKKDSPQNKKGHTIGVATKPDEGFELLEIIP